MTGVQTCALPILEFEFDDILKEVCMVFFFTSVGFQANLKVLKKGGKSLIVFLGLVVVLIFTQNFVAVGLSKLLGLNSLIGMCTGSIPMVGGHGTAGAFGPVLEDFNVQGATTICTAAATFGLIFGSIIGGPLGKRLIEKKDLLKTAIPEDDSLLVEDEKKHERQLAKYNKLVENGKKPTWKVTPPMLVDLKLAQENIVNLVKRLIESLEKDFTRAKKNYNEVAIALVDEFKAEAAKVVYKVTKKMAKAQAIKLLEEVGISEPAIRYKQYPFEFSGGMRQRIVIAIALASNPSS